MRTPVSYRTIKADLLRRIQSGEWPPGSRVPDEVELAESYGVARTTLARAMRGLVEDGIIERRRKAGTHVRMTPLRQARFKIPLVRDEITGAGADYRYELLRSAIVSAPPALVNRMWLAPQTRLRHLLCIHYANDKAYQLEDRWINLAAVPDAATADFTESGPNEWLVSKIPYSSAEIGFTAIEASAEEVQHLGCNPGAALFCIERRTEWEGQSLTYVKLTYRHGHRLTAHY